MAKSLETIRADLLGSFENLAPDLDLEEGSAERDVLVEGPLAGGFNPAWQQIDFLEKLLDIFNNATQLPTRTVNVFCNNFRLTRIEAVPSIGTATFYTNSFNEDITIEISSQIQTRDATPIIYEARSTQSFSASDAEVYLNPITNRYEFPVTIQSVDTGTNTGVGKNKLTVLTSPITGITGVTNNASISNGLSAESNTEFLTRLVNTFIGRTRYARSGLEAFLSQYYNDFKIVDANSEYFTRSRYPSGVDVYYPFRSPIVVSEIFTVPYANYTQGFILSNQPAVSIETVIGDVTGDITNYTFAKDSGILKNSTRGADGITFSDSGISDATVTVTYTYNSFLTEVQNDLDVVATKDFGQDILVRESTRVSINTVLKIQLVPGAVLDTVKGTITTAINTHINSLAQGGDVEKLQILQVAKTSGVLAIDFNTFELTSTNGGTTNAQGDIVIGDFEYPVPGETDVSPIDT